MADQREPIREPDNSTVDDWLGQEVDRDMDRAEQALAEAGGDEARAERLFAERSAGNEPEAVPSVPPDQRPA